MEIMSAEQQRMDFMKLLVTELQHQNPLEPLDNQQMAAQLAQFTQLDLSEKMNSNLDSMNAAMENLSSSFEGAMLIASLDYAKSLLGREITFYDETSGRVFEGKAERLYFKDQQPVLSVKATVTNPDGSSTEKEFGVKLNQIEGIGL